MNIVGVYKKFPTQNDCLAYLEFVRWKDKPQCPYCKSTKQSPLKKELRYHCNNCNTSYSVTVNTIFHKTRVDLQKWFLAISLILNAKKGISARQLARDLAINKNTAWYMAMRIRRAMVENHELLDGIVEVDETYIVGKSGSGTKRGRGTKKKPVVAAVQRGGKIIAKPVNNVSSKVLKSIIRENVDIKTATVMIDEFKGYPYL